MEHSIEVCNAHKIGWKYTLIFRIKAQAIIWGHVPLLHPGRLGITLRNLTVTLWTLGFVSDLH